MGNDLTVGRRRTDQRSLSKRSARERIRGGLSHSPLLGKLASSVEVAECRRNRPCGPRRLSLAFLSMALGLGLSGPAAGQATFAEPVVYLTPKIEGSHRYEPVERAERLAALLEALEPGGPAGAVQVGYTIDVRLLTIYRRDQDGEWQVDLSRLEEDLAVAAEIGRPIVVALNGNHFAEGLGSGGLQDALIADPRNLMAYQGGSPALDSYFGAAIVGYTLSTDRRLPVNAYRLRALAAALERIRAFADRHPDLFIGVELLGETHHLFPDLRGGADEFQSIQTTDYSQVSRRAFRQYLRDQGWTLEALNRAIGAAFPDWESVEPPGCACADDGSGVPDWAHWDSFAAGDFPVAGWVDDPRGIAGITLQLSDGAEIAATLNLNRTDVYDAVPDIETPNVGFRGGIDLRELAPGWHSVTVRVDIADGTSVSLGSRSVFVGSEAERALAPAPPPATGRDSSVASLRGAIDDPAAEFTVRYNPFATLWHDFRRHQVRAQTALWIDEAHRQGLSADQLYTYQVAPFLVGGWNNLLFAVTADFFRIDGARPGISAYGGTADTPHVFDLLGGRPYAITEFHPLRPRHPDAAIAAMRRHFEAGAVFISPFFLSLVPQALGQRDFEMFLIRPDNPNRGSDHVYHAIQRLAAE